MYSLAASLIISAVLSVPALAALPAGVPETIVPPVAEKIELKKADNGKPYFLLEVKVPQSILELDQTRPTDGAVFLDYYLSVDKGEFKKWDGGYLDLITEDEMAAVPEKPGNYLVALYPVEVENMAPLDISAHTYDVKLQFYYQYYYGEGPGEWDYIYSPFSNQITIGAVAVEKPAEQPAANQPVQPVLTEQKPQSQTPSASGSSSAPATKQAEPKLDDVPKTGDNSPANPVLPAAFLCLGGAAGIFVKRAFSKA